MSHAKVWVCFLFYLLLSLNELLKYSWICCGHLRKDLTVQLNFSFFKVTHKHTIAHTKRRCSGTDPRLLEPAICTLLQLTVAICIDTSFDGGGFCKRNFRFSSPHHALSSGENIFAAFDVIGTAFDSWHKIAGVPNDLGVRHQRLHTLGECIAKSYITSFIARYLSALTAIEMIFASFELQKFSGFCDLDALSNGFMRFHRCFGSWQTVPNVSYLVQRDLGFASNNS